MTTENNGVGITDLQDNGGPSQATTHPPPLTTGQVPSPSAITQAAAQTIVVQPIRYPAPGSFHGETDGFTAHQWVATVTRYLNGNNVPIASRTLQTLPFLKGDAGLWWESTGLPDDTPFADFLTEFNNAYVPDDFLLQVRLGLQTMTMTSTLSEFIARVRRFVAILTPVNASEAVLNEISITSRTTFLHGIPADLNSKIRTNTPTWKDLDLSALISLARHYDSIHHYSRDGPTTPSSSSSSLAPPRFSPTPTTYAYTAPAARDPMAMEIDNLRVEILAMQRSFNQRNNNYQQNNSYQRNNNNQNHNRHNNYMHQNRGNNNNNNTQGNPRQRLLPPTLTDDERAYLISIGACFRCCQAGHRGNDKKCPMYQLFSFSTQNHDQQHDNHQNTDQVNSTSGKD